MEMLVVSFLCYFIMKNKNQMIAEYVTAFDELHTLLSFSFRNSGNQNKEKRTEIVMEDLLSFLILAYTRGIQDISDMLGITLQVNLQNMQKAIYLQINSEDVTDRVATHISENDLSALLRLAETEYHRIYHTALQDGAEASGLDIVKTWITIGDEKVRDSHAYLDNMTIPLNERFYTYDGDSALFPGCFSNAEHNVNCRCMLQYTTRKGKILL